MQPLVFMRIAYVLLKAALRLNVFNGATYLIRMQLQQFGLN